MSNDQKRIYESLLRDIGALSRLFSESDKPFIHSRTAEYLYCKIFGAENLSRSDVAIDAKKNELGTGIKTFVYSGRPSYQKIAEFNRALPMHRDLSGVEKVRKVSLLRNERLRFVENTYETTLLNYHCILRDSEKILVYEEPMRHISLESIQVLREGDSSIRFTDGNSNYSFNISKSTLLKEFTPENILLEASINILEDPFLALERLSPSVENEPEYVPAERVVLPMYGYDGSERRVFERSGLNQWNAAGRPRNYDEVYLPVPRVIRERYPGFFPGRDQPFNLVLPNKKTIPAKISQEGGKALMSNPNSALGKWLLRDVLGLGDGQLLTYEKLAELGVDSVEISKKNELFFANFLPLNSYENFLNTTEPQV